MSYLTATFLFVLGLVIITRSKSLALWQSEVHRNVVDLHPLFYRMVLIVIGVYAVVLSMFVLYMAAF